MAAAAGRAGPEVARAQYDAPARPPGAQLKPLFTLSFP